MREMFLKRALPLLLCAVLLLGHAPLHVHGEEGVGLDPEKRQAVTGRQMDSWYFPLPEECFDDIVDLAGCRGWNENALYSGANAACTQADHNDLSWGSGQMIVNVSAAQPVYAPASGTLYRSAQPDAQWGDVAVLEVPVDSYYSYYILMGGVSTDAASGSYAEAGSVVGYTIGTFRYAAMMDYAGQGAQNAGNISATLDFIQGMGWLLGSTGTGMICVNPAADTYTQYPNPMVYDHGGPIRYQFVGVQAPQEPQPTQPEPQPTQPEPQPTQPEPQPTQPEPQPTQPESQPPQETAHTEHIWESQVVTPAGHTTNGVLRYTCTYCGATYDEAIPADPNNHTYDQQVAAEQYLAAPASCSTGAKYYYSCACGAVGTETFAYGEGTGAHSWNGGEVIVPASHTAGGTVRYTCTLCGATYEEAIPAVGDHSFDQEVVGEGYLASAATCDAPARYYYSCICGERGTETFPFGQAAPHSFSDQWTYDENNHYRAATCQHTGEVTDFGPHRWDDGVITKDAGHSVNGEKRYTCTVCGYQITEIIPGQPHEYNQEVVADGYLAAPATCDTPAQYYKSCVCGLAGTETFSHGEATGHLFSDKWSSDENQHWQEAICDHSDLKIKVAEHIWTPGEITVQPSATTKGEKTYTCTVCGRTKTEEVEPSTHQHTYSTNWSGNSTYHWHDATCEHTNVVGGLGEHTWNEGTVTLGASHNTPGTKVYTCTVCGMQKTETLNQTHTYDQQIASDAFLASRATCSSPATYFYSCTCGAKDTTRTFAYGSALGHSASGSWGKDANYHWTVCSRCGAKGDLVAHSFNANGVCTVCGGSKQDAHVHSSHLTQVPAKAATCTQPGNTAYYVCDCGMWFADVNTSQAITDQQSVVLPALGHVDEDNNGRCDLCKERMDNVVEYQMTEGGESTWLNTSAQGLVFRSNADYSKFDHVEVDGATVANTNYSVSQGSTIVELNSSYLKRLSLGRHTISIVAQDGKATTGFTIKQGAISGAGQSGGNGIWGIILFLTVVIAMAIPIAYGVYYYRKRTGDYT